MLVSFCPFVTQQEKTNTGSLAEMDLMLREGGGPGREGGNEGGRKRGKEGRKRRRKGEGQSGQNTLRGVKCSMRCSQSQAGASS